MIDLEQIKEEKCQPPFYEDLSPCHTSSPFFNFSESPLPYFKAVEGGGGNYAAKGIFGQRLLLAVTDIKLRQRKVKSLSLPSASHTSILATV